MHHTRSTSWLSYSCQILVPMEPQQRGIAQVTLRYFFTIWRRMLRIKGGFPGMWIVLSRSKSDEDGGRMEEDEEARSGQAPDKL